MRAWAGVLTAIVLGLVITTLVLAASWTNEGAPQEVRELMPMWALAVGLLTGVCFALGAPVAGIALCGALVGAILGAYTVGEAFSRPRHLFGAAVGASAGLVVVGFASLLLVRRPRNPCFQGALRFTAGGVLVVGLATAIILRNALEQAPCRVPNLGNFCHLDLISLLLVSNAVVLALLLLVSHRCSSP